MANSKTKPNSHQPSVEELRERLLADLPAVERWVATIREFCARKELSCQNCLKKAECEKHNEGKKDKICLVLEPHLSGRYEGAGYREKSGYPHNYDQMRSEATGVGVSMTASDRADTVYFDFVNKQLVMGDREEPIRDNQPWRFVELAVRYRMVDHTDAFIHFDEWRLARRQFNPKRRFQVIMSKANSLIKSFGLGLVRPEKDKSTCVMTGWDDARHKSNIGEAMIKLRKAFEAMRKRQINRESVLGVALEAFKLDPESLPAAFFIVECLRKLKEIEVNANLLRYVNRLLRQEESRYEDGIMVIERCEMLHNDNIGRRISSYNSILQRIRRRRRLAQALPQWGEIREGEETRIDKIGRHIRIIQQNSKTEQHADQMDHLQALLDLTEMRTAKRIVISKVKSHCPKDWRDNQSLEAEFRACFTELILEKVDCAKLQHAGSLASYVKRTVPSMLLDRAFQEACGLSISQVKAVQRLRKARQAVWQQTGRDPEDADVARELVISKSRLYNMKQWEQRLANVRFNEERDGGESDEDTFPSY